MCRPSASGDASYKAFCAWYEQRIVECGGIDLQVLGIGSDGHIAFNEPSSSLGSRTRIKTLAKQTIDDNARFLLYDSSGGYPIGIFTMYVRSSVEERGEVGKSQLFFAVGFNFYGKESRPKIGIINKIWESIHNRVTGNVLNRFKQLCEWRFQRIQDGRYHQDSKLEVP